MQAITYPVAILVPHLLRDVEDPTLVRKSRLYGLGGDTKSSHAHGPPLATYLAPHSLRAPPVGTVFYYLMAKW